LTESIQSPDYPGLFKDLRLKTTELIYTINDLDYHSSYRDLRSSFSAAKIALSGGLNEADRVLKQPAANRGFEDLKKAFEDTKKVYDETMALIAPILDSNTYKRFMGEMLGDVNSSYTFITATLESFSENRNLDGAVDFISPRAIALFKVLGMMREKEFGYIGNIEISGYHGAAHFAKRMIDDCLNEIEVTKNPNN